MSRIRAEAVGNLLIGACGKYDFGLLGDVAELLKVLLSHWQDTESLLALTFTNDHFFLGDQARRVALTFLMRCADQRNAPSTADLTIFLERIWELHQTEDANALPASDVVSWFIEKYN